MAAGETEEHNVVLGPVARGGFPARSLTSRLPDSSKTAISPIVVVVSPIFLISAHVDYKKSIMFKAMKLYKNLKSFVEFIRRLPNLNREL